MADVDRVERTLAAAREHYGAPSEARERLRCALEASGHLAGAASAGQVHAARPPLPVRAAGVSKPAAALLAGLTFLAGLWLGNRMASEGAAALHAVPAPAPITSAASASPSSPPAALDGAPPESAKLAMPALDPALQQDTLPAPRASATKRTPVAQAARPATEQDPPSTELVLLQRADRAIRAGEAELALSFLTELDRRYPETRLGEERKAARLLARCAQGDARAQAEAERFLREQRASVYSDRVRELCQLERWLE